MSKSKTRTDDDLNNNDDDDEGTPPFDWPSEVVESFRRGKDRQQDLVQFSQRLYDDNFKLREANRSLKRRLRQAESTPEDQKLVAKEDAELLEQYKALGTPEELGKAKDAPARLAELERQERVRLATDMVGVDAAELQRLVPGLDAKVFTPDGQDDEQAFVVVPNGDGTKEVPVLDYIDKHLSKYKALLLRDSPEPEQQGFRQHTGQRSSSSGDGKTKAPVVDFLNKRYAKS